MPDFDAMLEGAKPEEENTEVENVEVQNESQEEKVQPEPEPPKELEPPKPPEVKKEHVPLKTYLQERERARQVERELKELREQIEELKKTDPPDYDEDPQGYIDHKVASLKQEPPKQENQEDTYLASQIAADTQQVISEHPDFADALDHVRNTLYHQHLLSGLPEDQIIETITNAETNLAKALFAQGQSPSKFIYEYATQHGYKPSPKEEKKADEKIETINKGKKTASPTPGGDAVPSRDVPAEEGVKGFDQAMAESFSFLRKK